MTITTEDDLILISAVAGETVTFNVNAQDDDDEDLDLSSYTATLTFKRSNGSVPLGPFSIGSGIAYDGDELTVTFSTATVPAGGDFILTLTDGTGRKYISKGYLALDKEPNV